MPDGGWPGSRVPRPTGCAAAPKPPGWRAAACPAGGPCTGASHAAAARSPPTGHTCNLGFPRLILESTVSVKWGLVANERHLRRVLLLDFHLTRGALNARQRCSSCHTKITRFLGRGVPRSSSSDHRPRYEMPILNISKPPQRRLQGWDSGMRS